MPSPLHVGIPMVLRRMADQLERENAAELRQAARRSTRPVPPKRSRSD